jgi:hypothetical protein
VSNPRALVILSAAKNLVGPAVSREILRCAQDDRCARVDCCAQNDRHPVNGSARAPSEHASQRVSAPAARRHEINVIVPVQNAKGYEKLQKLPRRKQLAETKNIATTTLTHVRRLNRQLSICSLVHRVKQSNKRPPMHNLHIEPYHYRMYLSVTASLLSCRQ